MRMRSERPILHLRTKKAGKFTSSTAVAWLEMDNFQVDVILNSLQDLKQGLQ